MQSDHTCLPPEILASAVHEAFALGAFISVVFFLDLPGIKTKSYLSSADWKMMGASLTVVDK